jgi:RsiW-degrading membrane proteinase PrsW (M82 family)
MVWLLSLPLRLIGITVAAGFALVRTLLYLPARMLGWKPSAGHAS